jgi:hypothetical protein
LLLALLCQTDVATEAVMIVLRYDFKCMNIRKHYANLRALQIQHPEGDLQLPRTQTYTAVCPVTLLKEDSLEGRPWEILTTEDAEDAEEDG